MDQNQLEQIGAYVKDHMTQWMQEKNILPFQSREKSRDTELLERMVTVEQQLKFQNEKIELLIKQSDKRFTEMQVSMDKRFEAVDKRFSEMHNYMDKRFEAVDKRFESVDKRFEDMQSYMDKRFNVQTWFISVGFTVITVLMSLYRFLG